ncbi:GNAT family N-acetyltransferase [Micromonospora polyrhachis]|uniref:Ribosomal-protein-alanine N-acetyltransferase n=1 Tax=Micromonospora polyrhachis TaxID=1282883 RepID=A0A7W7WS89_9ACTN|nr:GNAT family N-acetyltransferase [Micromonospora polyrhachis]MBB4961996.1 ribosomal-protein-alanine N-acetyltransferase [Micromonospora polyrhachis]
MSVSTRLVQLEDAPILAELLQVNRDFLAPWEPVRADDYCTVEGQREVVRTALDQHEQGVSLPWVILDAEQVVGRITLSSIVRGAFQSCHLGYWVSAAVNGRGVATAAVRDIVRVAFEELGLHRIEAGALPHNVASQRVLERTGFTRFGLAPKYLHIAGEWQDHVMYQLVTDHPG